MKVSLGRSDKIRIEKVVRLGNVLSAKLFIASSVYVFLINEFNDLGVSMNPKKINSIGILIGKNSGEVQILLIKLQEIDL